MSDQSRVVELIPCHTHPVAQTVTRAVVERLAGFMHPQPRGLSRNDNWRTGAEPHNRARPVTGGCGGKPVRAKAAGADLIPERCRLCHASSVAQPVDCVNRDLARSTPAPIAAGMTDLDLAHAAMTAAPDEDAARLRFYERLADTELFMLLAGEPEGEKITPEVFEIEGQSFVLVFDREDRLSGFVGRAAPYAGLPGRGLARMLAGQGIGLGLNLQSGASDMLIPAEAVDWLVATLDHAPVEAEARLSEITRPAGLPEAVITGLDRKLAIAAGLAQMAYLAGATYEGGAKGHVLAFVNAVDGAEKALATAAGEALTFSGIDAGMIDVMFVQASDPIAGHLAKVGLRFDLPVPETPTPPAAPGSDPTKPPRLR